MKNGDWVCRSEGVGKIKHVHTDGVLDIVLYDREGARIGRVSPAYSGPRTFEPCCEPSLWTAIEEPDWPLPEWGRLILGKHVKPLAAAQHGDAEPSEATDGGAERPTQR